MKKTLFIFTLFVSVFANGQTIINLYTCCDTHTITVPADTVWFIDTLYVHDTIQAICDTTPLPQDTLVASDSIPGYLLFLVIGQSNASGFAPLTSGDSTSGAYLWNGAWIPANGWLNKYSTVYPNGVMNGGKSFANSFGAIAAAESLQKVGLVVNAKPNTGIVEWRYNTTALITTSINSFKTALASDSNNRIGGILWHQGEWDAEQHTEGCYKANFDFIRAMVDAQLGDTVPIFVGGLYKGNTLFDSINNVLPQLEDNTFKWLCPDAGCVVACNHSAVAGWQNLPYLHDVYYVDSQGLTTIGDNYHFNALSQTNFGLRYWSRYKQMVP